MDETVLAYAMYVLARFTTLIVVVLRSDKTTKRAAEGRNSDEKTKTEDIETEPDLTGGHVTR